MWRQRRESAYMTAPFAAVINKAEALTGTIDTGPPFREFLLEEVALPSAKVQGNRLMQKRGITRSCVQNAVFFR